MDKEQFNQLLAAVNGLGSKIDEKFSQQPTEPKPEAADPAEPKTVTAEEFNALKDKFDDLQEKFNALSKIEVTPVPAGEGGNDETKFNMAV